MRSRPRTARTPGGYVQEPAPPASGSDGNTFEDEGVGGSVDTATDSRSTFALDVDNGSYRVAQAFVAEGVRPPSESVRAEEWVNAFDYGDPAPTEADLAVRAESGVRPAPRTAARSCGSPSPPARWRPRSGRR